MYLIRYVSCVESDVHIVPERSHKIAVLYGSISRECLVGKAVVPSPKGNQSVRSNLPKKINRCLVFTRVSILWYLQRLGFVWNPKKETLWKYLWDPQNHHLSLEETLDW